jgi:hypothetical protein
MNANRAPLIARLNELSAMAGVVYDWEDAFDVIRNASQEAPECEKLYTGFFCACSMLAFGDSAPPAIYVPQQPRNDLNPVFGPLNHPNRR